MQAFRQRGIARRRPFLNPGPWGPLVLFNPARAGRPSVAQAAEKIPWAKAWNSGVNTPSEGQAKRGSMPKCAVHLVCPVMLALNVTSRPGEALWSDVVAP